jgi:hypothetical protein
MCSFTYSRTSIPCVRTKKISLSQLHEGLTFEYLDELNMSLSFIHGVSTMFLETENSFCRARSAQSYNKSSMRNESLNGYYPLTSFFASPERIRSSAEVYCKRTSQITTVIYLHSLIFAISERIWGCFRSRGDVIVFEALMRGF